THPGRHRYRRDLDDVDRALTDDVASQNVVGCAVDDQLAEPVRPSVDDRAGGGIEADDPCHDVVRFAGARFGQAHLGVLRIREAPDRDRPRGEHSRRTEHRVRGRDEALLYGLGDEQEVTGHVAGCKDVRRQRRQVSGDPNALKTEATCAPVAPAPMTSIEGGTAVRLHASLCVAVYSTPGTESRRGTPPVQTITFSACSRSPLSVSMVCGSTNRAMPARSWTATPAESICPRKAEWARTSFVTSRTRVSSRRYSSAGSLTAMPYCPSCRDSRIRRAAWASVRTGTGPSLAAIPPNSPRVTRAVFAPKSAARSAATTPAGPAPTTT